MDKLVSNVVSEKKLRIAQARALELFSDVISKTYGPMGGFTCYSKQNVDQKTLAVSYYTKDGATVLKNIQTDKPIESLIKDEIIDICTQVIKDVGDGTSSATIMSHLMFDSILELMSKYPKRLVIQAFNEVVKETSDFILKQGRECTLEDIYNITLTSTDGNKDMAELITKIYDEYGMGVFIDVMDNNQPQTIYKGYDGLCYDSGYLDPAFVNSKDEQGRSIVELHNAKIFTFESPIDTPDMMRMLDNIIKREVIDPMVKIQNKVNMARSKGNNYTPDPKEYNQVLIVCPFIGRDANSMLDQLITTYQNIDMSHRMPFCLVSNMNDDPDKIVDIMKMTGSKFIKKYIDPEIYKADQEAGLAPTEFNLDTFAGTAEKVIVDANSMKIINPGKMRDENGKITTFFTNYIKELNDLLHKYEETRMELVKIGKLKRRIHILQGNMVDLHVGGIGVSDKKSLTDSVEDAVLNCRSAAVSGVGYGANYEGLYATTVLSSKYYPEFSKIIQESADNPDDMELKKKAEYATVKNRTWEVFRDAYITLVSKIYLPYFDNDKKKTMLEVLKFVIDSNGIEPPYQPLNIVTGEFDGKVLSSIKSEPSILLSMSRIISVILKTNQFLVPDPRFNIYEWDEPKNEMKINNTATPNTGINSSEAIMNMISGLMGGNNQAPVKQLVDTISSNGTVIAHENE